MARFRESETSKSDIAVQVFGDLFYKAFNPNQMISLDAWIFRERKGFCSLSGFGITACPSIHAAVVASDLRTYNSSQSAQLTDSFAYLPATYLKSPFLKPYRFNSWIFSNTL